MFGKVGDMAAAAVSGAAGFVAGGPALAAQFAWDAVKISSYLKTVEWLKNIADGGVAKVSEVFDGSVAKVSGVFDNVVHYASKNGPYAIRKTLGFIACGGVVGVSMYGANFLLGEATKICPVEGERYACITQTIAIILMQMGGVGILAITGKHAVALLSGQESPQDNPIQPVRKKTSHSTRIHRSQERNSSSSRKLIEAAETGVTHITNTISVSADLASTGVSLTSRSAKKLIETTEETTKQVVDITTGTEETNVEKWSRIGEGTLTLFSSVVVSGGTYGGLTALSSLSIPLAGAAAVAAPIYGGLILVGGVGLGIARLTGKYDLTNCLPKL